MFGIIQLEGTKILKEAIMENPEDACKHLVEYFQENYPDYLWHAVDFNTRYIQSTMSILFEVDYDKTYLLFATKK